MTFCCSLALYTDHSTSGDVASTLCDMLSMYLVKQSDTLTHACTQSFFSVMLVWLLRLWERRKQTKQPTPQWVTFKVRFAYVAFPLSFLCSSLIKFLILVKCHVSYLCAQAASVWSVPPSSSSPGFLHSPLTFEQWISLCWVGQQLPGAAAPTEHWRPGCPSSPGCLGTTWSGFRWTCLQASLSGWPLYHRRWLMLK